MVSLIPLAFTGEKIKKEKRKYILQGLAGITFL
jgi:hypothetical protein